MGGWGGGRGLRPYTRLRDLDPAQLYVFSQTHINLLGSLHLRAGCSYAISPEQTRPLTHKCWAHTRIHNRTYTHSENAHLGAT